jgi:hypothetical protein
VHRLFLSADALVKRFHISGAFSAQTQHNACSFGVFVDCFKLRRLLFPLRKLAIDFWVGVSELNKGEKRLAEIFDFFRKLFDDEKDRMIKLAEVTVGIEHRVFDFDVSGLNLNRKFILVENMRLKLVENTKYFACKESPL